MKKWDKWERITSGNKELDKYITAPSEGGSDKGIPAGYAILVEKAVGTKAGLFSLFFIIENLRKQRKAAYLTTDKDPYWIIDRIEDYFGENISRFLGRDPDKNFAIIDGFRGGHLRAETKIIKDVFPINDLRNIQEVHDVLREVMLTWGHYVETVPRPRELDKCNGIWVYDSVTTLIHYGGEEALSFIAHQMAAQKKHSYTSLFIIERNSLPLEYVAKLRIWADGFIKLWKDDECSPSKRFLQVVEMRWWNHYDGQIEYFISDEGLKIKETQEMKAWLKKWDKLEISSSDVIIKPQGGTQ
ncbi:MAG: ATPase domain-containing protein [archaeon]|nr:ATPase domain-containing protein [archaeon]